MPMIPNFLQTRKHAAWDPLIPLFWDDLSQFSKKPNKTLLKFIFTPLLFHSRLFHLKALFNTKNICAESDFSVLCRRPVINLMIFLNLFDPLRYFVMKTYAMTHNANIFSSRLNVLTRADTAARRQAPSQPSPRQPHNPPKSIYAFHCYGLFV